MPSLEARNGQVEAGLRPSNGGVSTLKAEVLYGPQSSKEPWKAPLHQNGDLHLCGGGPCHFSIGVAGAAFMHHNHLHQSPAFIEGAFCTGPTGKYFTCVHYLI